MHSLYALFSNYKLLSWTISTSENDLTAWSVERISVTNSEITICSEQVGEWSGLVNSTALLWGAQIPTTILTSFSTVVGDLIFTLCVNFCF